MEKELQTRKQEFVRAAIYDAAIELFAARGFDETTVEEVALAAGVSRRSFFRYFASKDDLLAQSVVNYGEVLAAAIQQSSPDLTPFGVLQQVVMSGVKYTAAPGSRTRKVVEIAVRSPSARQAHASRMMEIEDKLASAYVARLARTSNSTVRPRLLAGITLTVMSSTIVSWYMGEHDDLAAAARHVLRDLKRTLNEKPTQISRAVAASPGKKRVGRKTAGAKPLKTS